MKGVLEGQFEEWKSSEKARMQVNTSTATVVCHNSN